MGLKEHQGALGKGKRLEWVYQTKALSLKLFSRGGSRAGNMFQPETPGEAEVSPSRGPDGSPGPGSHHSKDVCSLLSPTSGNLA